MSVTRVKTRGEKNNTSWRCARDVRRGPERQRVKIKPIYCDSFSLTWTAFGEYRGELTKNWTELGVLLRVLSRECDCCGTELCAWATREGRCSSRLLRWRLILRECLFPSKKELRYCEFLHFCSTTVDIRKKYTDSIFVVLKTKLISERVTSAVVSRKFFTCRF